MQIQINKDIEEAYKDELIKGFSLREAAYIGISLVIIVGMVVLVYLKFGIMPDTGIYIGLPFGIPTLFLGFYTYQGQTVVQYLKEIIFVCKTKVLTYDADELPEESYVFTMERRSKEKRRKGWDEIGNMIIKKH